jgi:hypothetical protein
MWVPSLSNRKSARQLSGAAEWTASHKSKIRFGCGFPCCTPVFQELEVLLHFSEGKLLTHCLLDSEHEEEGMNLMRRRNALKGRYNLSPGSAEGATLGRNAFPGIGHPERVGQGHFRLP